MKGTTLGLVLVLSVSGCTAVAPWEHGHLAKPHMVLGGNAPERAFREHIYRGREAAIGSSAPGGGSCGCY
jgi:hypothetical protein